MQEMDENTLTSRYCKCNRNRKQKCFKIGGKRVGKRSITPIIIIDLMEQKYISLRVTTNLIRKIPSRQINSPNGD